MGNTQIDGVDCGETFAPMGKPTSLRLIIAIAAFNGWEVHQLNAVTAFLNCSLDEEVYGDADKMVAFQDIEAHARIA